MLFSDNTEKPFNLMLSHPLKVIYMLRLLQKLI